MADKKQIIFSVVFLSVFFIFRPGFPQDLLPSASAELTLADVISVAFQNNKEIQIAESAYSGSLEVQRQTLRAKKLDLEFEAKRLYCGLLLGYEALRIAKDALAQAVAHYENVNQMYKQGRAPRFDLLQSGMQVSLLEPDLVRAKNEIESLKADLNKFLSRKVDFPIETKEKLSYLFIDIKENEFLKSAYLNRPEVKLKSLGVDIDKWGIQMAKSGWHPQVDFLSGYSWRANNLDNLFSGKQSNWNAGLVVNIPIFEVFSTKAKVEAAGARFAQAKLSQENLYDQIAVQVRKGCLNLKEAAAIIQSQKDNVGEAKEALRIAEVSYAAGVAINLDVLDAQVSLIQVQRNLVSGIYDYLMALAYLDRSMGKPFIMEKKDEK